MMKVQLPDWFVRLGKAAFVVFVMRLTDSIGRKWIMGDMPLMFIAMRFTGIRLVRTLNKMAKLYAIRLILETWFL